MRPRYTFLFVLGHLNANWVTVRDTVLCTSCTLERSGYTALMAKPVQRDYPAIVEALLADASDKKAIVRALERGGYSHVARKQPKWFFGESPSLRATVRDGFAAAGREIPAALAPLLVEPEKVTPGQVARRMETALRDGGKEVALAVAGVAREHLEKLPPSANPAEAVKAVASACDRAVNEVLPPAGKEGRHETITDALRTMLKGGAADEVGAHIMNVSLGKEKGDFVRLGYSNTLMDRTEGKPVQSIRHAGVFHIQAPTGDALELLDRWDRLEPPTVDGEA